MSVVKFKLEKQRKMKGISKALYLLSKFGQIILSLGAIVTVLLAFVTPILISNMKVENDTILVFDGRYEFKIEESAFSFDGARIKVDVPINVKEFLANHSTMFFILSSEYIIVGLFITLIVIIILLNYLGKLFLNIYHNNTPFTLDNVTYKKSCLLAYSFCFTS